MDWTAVAIFAAFIAYQYFRERKDERLYNEREAKEKRMWDERAQESNRVAIERQNNCHQFHRDQSLETMKIFERVANALETYTKAVAEQADRHKIQNENYILILENEELKSQIKILAEANIVTQAQPKHP